jgi:hypothetical protein
MHKMEECALLEQTKVKLILLVSNIEFKVFVLWQIMVMWIYPVYHFILLCMLYFTERNIHHHMSSFAEKTALGHISKNCVELIEYPFLA